MNFSDDWREAKLPIILSLILLAMAYGFGLFIPIFDHDPAHHANIGLHMYLTGDYISLIDIGNPYLDKPHLLFWLSALSYHVFGVTSFAYRFPTFLFSILAIYSTFRLGSLLFNQKTGVYGALLLSSAFAFSLANQDVRMDGILTGAIMFSFWNLVRFHLSNSWKHLFLGILGLSLGFMTKGLIGPAVSGIFFGFYILEKRAWEVFSNYKFWLIFPIFLLFSSPVIYAYFVQFDLNPDLVIRGEAGRSGVKFILWEQNFERFQGDSFGNSGKKDPFVFFNAIWWSALPWPLIFYIALIWFGLMIWQGFPLANWSIVAGTLFILLIFSLSGFKLPHYLIPLIPMMSLITAYWMTSAFIPKWFLYVHTTILSIALAAIIILSFYSLNGSYILILLGLTILIVSIFYLKNSNFRTKFFVLTLVFGSLSIFLMQSNVYRPLMFYQAGHQLANDFTEKNMTTEEVYFFQVHSTSFDFYTGRLHKKVEESQLMERLAETGNILVYTNTIGLNILKETYENLEIEVIAQKPNYEITKIKSKFLNPKTRTEVVDTNYIALITHQ